ncbi:hypothetical protein [Streptomyces mirabilis]|uniref:hypothetical protein n=1 Tax=Streptomyces mirabilis TaxID=68239 RepID=UPI0036DACED6
MIVGVIVFAVVGIGSAIAQIIKRQWLQASGVLLVTVSVEMGYATMALHQSWLAIAATVVLMAAAVLAWRAKRYQARGAEGRQPG